MADGEKLSFNPWSTKDNGVFVSLARVSESAAILLGAIATGQECLIWPAGAGLLLSLITQKAALPDHRPADKPGKYSIRR